MFRRATVWAGPDHILLVEGSRTSETYKRVYYRDVQALLVSKRNRFVISAWLWLLPIVLFIAVLRLPSDWMATGSFAAVLIVLAVIIYLLAAGRSYSCRLYLATAVGNVEAPSVYRVWQARRFNERLKPFIVDAQQALVSPESEVPAE
jgi:uncharacterized membrane protein (DUF485 family)